MPVIRSEASTDALLDAVAQLPKEELTAFVRRVATMRAERVSPHVSHDEADLLLRIGRGLSADRRRRYDASLPNGTTNPSVLDEHAELLELTNEVECLDADRAEAIIALAGLRRVSPTIVLQSLGIQPASDGP